MLHNSPSHDHLKPDNHKPVCIVTLWLKLSAVSDHTNTSVHAVIHLLFNRLFDDISRIY